MPVNLYPKGTAVALYTTLFITTLLHAFTCGLEVVIIPFWAFLVLPVMLLLRVLTLLFIREEHKYAIKFKRYWANTFYAWTIFALAFHIIFLRWSLTELLFLGTILYAGSMIQEQKYFSNVFLIGLIGESLSIIVHHILSANEQIHSYQHPSGTIMTLGVLSTMAITHLHSKGKAEEELRQRQKAEDKSETLIQLIAELSNILKNPVESVKIKADILKLREGFSEDMDEMKLELNAIFKLFQRLEQSVKAEYTKENSLNIIQELDYDLPTKVIQLCDEPLGSRPKEVRYLGAMLDLIFDKTAHLSGIKPELKLYLSEARVHISIEFLTNERNEILEGEELKDIISSELEVLRNLADEIQYLVTITDLNDNLLQVDLYPNDSAFKGLD